MCIIIRRNYFLMKYILQFKPVSETIEQFLGHCHGYLERYYFSKKDNKCLPFMYSGCAGNGNNFASKTECMAVCMNNSRNFYGNRKAKGVEYVTIIPRIRSDCSKMIRKGQCSGSIKMYGYDKVTGKCRNFTYTGCGGNSNRFFTLSSCKAVCEAGGISKAGARKPWIR